MKLRILLSYHYYKKTDLDQIMRAQFGDPYPEVFADSGAFSAETQGASINLEEYAAWLFRWRHWFTTYANLDVIGAARGDPESTWANQKRLEDKGLRPLPCFHTREDWSWLEKYLDEYNYIALGGLVPFSGARPAYVPWLVRCFQLAKARAVFHGFGVTTWRAMRDFPWYSVDSSSWGQGFRYGVLCLFCPRRKKRQRMKMGTRAVYKEAELIRWYGFDPALFAVRDPAIRPQVCTISALSSMVEETHIRSYRGLITPPGASSSEINTTPPTTDPGLKFYIVDGSPENLTNAAAGIKIFLGEASHNAVDAQSVFAYLTKKAFL